MFIYVCAVWQLRVRAARSREKEVKCTPKPAGATPIVAWYSCHCLRRCLRRARKASASRALRTRGMARARQEAGAAVMKV